jgi:phage terminase small subunit
MALTHKKEMFAIHYFKNGKSSEAYKHAYSTGRMGAATISNNAYVLLKDNDVAMRIEELKKKAETDAVMTKQEALERLSCTGRMTISDVANFSTTITGYDEEGKPIETTSWAFNNSADMPKNALAAIKSVTATAMGPKIEMHDPHAAIKQIADILGWNAATKTELSGELGVKNEWHIHPTSPITGNDSE